MSVVVPGELELLRASVQQELCLVANPPPWRQLVPFAYWMIDALRPKTFVELGTHTGVSYSAFCRAVQLTGTSCRCYAVDTWLGDEHAGFFSSDVYETLSALHAMHFSDFSSLIRSTFEDALPHFGEKSIDLLHIDGRHDYESVSHDFYTWLPKLTDRGVVLFHDINVRERNFGVWRFWEEISRKYPSFAFLHSNGLGVLAVGADVPERIKWLTGHGGDDDFNVQVRGFFSQVGLQHEAMLERPILKSEVRDVHAQLASEAARSLKACAEWQERAEYANARLDEAVARWHEEARRFEEIIGAIRRSASWRLTAPFRSGIARIGLGNWQRLSRFPRRVVRVLVRGFRALRAPYRGDVAAPALNLRLFVGAWLKSTDADVSAPSSGATSDAAVIARSALFDEGWYCANYSIMGAGEESISRLDAINHYLTSGAARGYNPNPVFDTGYYLAINQDVVAAGVNPLVHYLMSGAIEGRRPSLFFDPMYYLARHPDLEAEGPDALAHYLHQGARDGTAANAGGFQIHSNDRNADLERVLTERLQSAEYRPTITIVTPVYNVDPVLLRKAVESVRKQLYANWELCLCDDGSTSAATLACLKSLQAIDPRIRVRLQPVNQGISAASNMAASMGTGEFVAMLDHDDELTSDALAEVVLLLNQQHDLDVIYSDQDKINTEGWVCDRFFKPQWSPELLRGVMYVGHLLVVRRELLDRIGGFDSQFDKVQDFELMLRASEHTSRIAHIPKILYHWRKVIGSVALGSDEKSDIEELQAKAVEAHLARLRIAAAVESQAEYRHRVRTKPLAGQNCPLVSIIIPTRDAPEHISRCLHSVFTVTSYPNFEVVLVDNGTTDREALDAIAKYDVVRVSYDKPFNFSEANNLGVAAAKGEIVLLLNNDTEVIDPGWLETLVFFLSRPGVGAVGAKLLYPNRTIQHAGVALGMRGTADHVMRGFPEHTDGYAGSLSCSREVSAVTGACLMVRKSDYNALGGLVTYYRTHYQDVDFCLRLRNRGLRVIFTPDATLIHHESASRGGVYDLVDRALFIDQWDHMIAAGDPYFNPNFCIEKGDYSLSCARWAS
ncbi:MAG TPA: glycosyltransferase [Ancylobacter sp.]